jgi:hypothetical protein
MRGGFVEMRLVIAIMVIAIVASVASPCLAGNNPLGKVAVHVRPHNAKLACNAGTILDCTDVVETEASFSVDAFPVFYDLVEFLGVEYGLNWPAWTYSAAFTSCSDLVIDAVDWPGSGAAHTWTSCQTGVAIPSFVWLYADGAGQICPTDNPSVGAIRILDCSEALDIPTSVFCAGVYGATGDDPCQDATEATTWGAIKNVFR